MPKDTQVLSVKVNNNIATVDFNKAFKTNFTGGSTGELMLIGSIVNSLTEFKDIKAVRFTVEGKVLEALDNLFRFNSTSRTHGRFVIKNKHKKVFFHVKNVRK